MKKFFYILMSVAMLSCITEDGLIEDQGVKTQESMYALSSKSDINPVCLLKSSASATNYRGLRAWSREFTVKVRNIAYDKKVSIYHKTVSGDWAEIPLAYDRAISDEYEIWYGVTYDRWTRVYDDEFAVKYEVNGSFYWDDNRGNNYIMEEASGALFGVSELAVSVDLKNVGLFSMNGGKKRFFVVADIKNSAPQKNVEVVYTTDGWNTVSYLPFEFKAFYSSGYNYAIPNPNPYGIERWSTFVELDESIEEVLYAVVHRVNGQEYWDNNYGKNYIIK